MSKIVTTTLAMMLLAFLTACAGSSEFRQPPGYAFMVGIDDYQVNCGTTTIIVDDNSTEIFFHSDGSEKTRMEFCEEDRTSTRIRR